MKTPPTPFQTAYRLVIMVGTLACGSLAAVRYGPEPDQLAEMIDSAASMVVEVTPHETVAEPAPLAEPFSTASSAPAAAPAMETPRFDPAVSPATALTPIERPAVMTPVVGGLERERLTAPLLASGATRADVTPWGAGATPLYRATASVAVGGGATGLMRQFDAMGETPEAAVAALDAELRAAVIR